MSEIPLPPTVTRMILAARRYGCVAPVITVAASFSTRPVFVRPPGREEEADKAHRRFLDRRSDFLTLLAAVRAWRAQGPAKRQFAERNFLHERALEEIEAVSAQIAAILGEHDIAISHGSKADDIGRSIAAGLAANLLTSDDGRSYRSRLRGGIAIFPGSSLYDHGPRHAVAAEIIETKRVYARNLQIVPSHWVTEIFPEARKKRQKGRSAKRERYFHPR